MLITREMDYALRILRSLHGSEMKNAAQIAEEEYISKGIALKILKQLRSAGILDGQRGPGGGYSFKVDPASLSLYDVFDALDEKLYLNKCQDPSFVCHNREKGCGFCKELNRIQSVLWQEMTKTPIVLAFEFMGSPCAEPIFKKDFHPIEEIVEEEDE